MKNSFNHLLIVLACFDNIFLVFCLLDYSLARVFHWYVCMLEKRFLRFDPIIKEIFIFRPLSDTGEMYALMFPKFLYPLNSITLRYLKNKGHISGIYSLMKLGFLLPITFPCQMGKPSL